MVRGGLSFAISQEIRQQTPSPIAHELSVATLQAYLDDNGKTSREQAKIVLFGRFSDGHAPVPIEGSD